MTTGIEWTDETWNPVTGCSHVSPGCEFCYAEKLSLRRGWSTHPWGAQYAAENVVLHPERLDAPLHWKGPRKVFVNSMSDLFHERVSDEFIAAVFGVMAACPQHTFQILTKRPERMVRWFDGVAEWTESARAVFPDDPPDWRLFQNLRGAAVRQIGTGLLPPIPEVRTWPVPNVWLGVSVEDQRRADERIPLLLQTPAAVRFLSIEPLLGPVNLGHLAWVSLPRLVHGDWPVGHAIIAKPGVHPAYVNPHGAVSALVGGVSLGIKPAEMDWCRKIDWAIVGGESGGPEERRLVTHLGNRLSGEIWTPKPEALAWVRSLRDQCVSAGVAFFFKQFGGPTPKAGGDILDGHRWHQFPDGKGGIEEGE